ncbi:phenylalanine--tRNA ligase subunit beta [Candidatus Marinamargulisbacteria bacterium SCGC AG-414-C22]|nr:phenylalanine--tRNA ligase subunit beta [Candidatus Marinamargulisbacteria bacterium SCGC AG-414-C22]
MKFPLSWLKEYVDINLEPTALAEKLTMAGLEVDDVDHIGALISGIITVKINTIKPHPNADKLVITECFDGKSTHTVVTGAHNITEGDIVPLALPGSTIASGMTLKPVALRGVDSFGMLCSEKELGASDESAGIWILDNTTPLGVNFEEYACLKDTIFDIAILPNRGDCQSIYGLAREIAALTQQKLHPIDTHIKTVATKQPFSVTVTEPELCPLYIGRHVAGIKHVTSPLIIQRRLQLAGIRPIDFIVDVTNYVLLECGQPLHAFDAQKCTSNSFKIATDKTKTHVTTLDGNKRVVDPGMLLIYNDTPAAIAGVMGCANTEVSNTTTEIFLEAAYFDSKHVRKNGTTLGLRTESSIRFEKGINIDSVDLASQRACHLLQRYADAQITKDTCIVKHTSDYRFQQQAIPFNVDHINNFLGSSFTTSEMTHILTTLGFIFSSKKDEVTVPVWRIQDVKEWPCLAEEIARLIGFDRIPATLPAAFTIQDEEAPEQYLVERFQTYFVDNGFLQSCTYPMISEKEFESFTNTKPTTHHLLQNPISPELACLRSSLLPSLTRIIDYHVTRQMSSCQFFEIGKVFADDHTEHQQLGLITVGDYHTNAVTDAQKKCNLAPFAYLKGHIENLFQKLGLQLTFKQQQAPSWAHPTQWINLCLGKKIIGTLALLHPSVVQNVTTDVCYLECLLDPLFTLQQTDTCYQPFSRFPSTRRDLSILVDKTVHFADIETVIKQYKHKLLKHYFLFDCFESEKLGSDKKSMAIGFIYQDDKGTCSDDKINSIHTRLTDRLTSELSLQIR